LIQYDIPPIPKKAKGRRLNICDTMGKDGLLEGCRWMFVSGEKDEYKGVWEHYCFSADDIE
jgi:hypothetical protein